MYSFKLLTVTMACVLLATKLEETPLRARFIFSVFDRLLKRQSGRDCTPLSEQRFQLWDASCKETEGVILHALGYELYVDMPHKFILHFINYLHPTALDEDDANERQIWSSLNQRCWNTLNDALLSSRVLFQYEPEVIACTAIYLSANELDLTLPTDWWQLFDVPTETLLSCAIDITRIYRLLSEANQPLTYQPTDADDNAQTNELIVYAPKNRAALLIERRKQLEAQQQQQRNVSVSTAATSSGSSTQAIGSNSMEL